MTPVDKATSESPTPELPSSKGTLGRRCSNSRDFTPIEAQPKKRPAFQGSSPLVPSQSGTPATALAGIVDGLNFKTGTPSSLPPSPFWLPPSGNEPPSSHLPGAAVASVIRSLDSKQSPPRPSGIRQQLPESDLTRPSFILGTMKEGQDNTNTKPFRSLPRAPIKAFAIPSSVLGNNFKKPLPPGFGDAPSSPEGTTNSLGGVVSSSSASQTPSISLKKGHVRSGSLPSDLSRSGPLYFPRHISSSSSVSNTPSIPRKAPPPTPTRGRKPRASQLVPTPSSIQLGGKHIVLTPIQTEGTMCHIFVIDNSSGEISSLPCGRCYVKFPIENRERDLYPTDRASLIIGYQIQYKVLLKKFQSSELVRPHETTFDIEQGAVIQPETNVLARDFFSLIYKADSTLFFRLMTQLFLNPLRCISKDRLIGSEERQALLSLDIKWANLGGLNQEDLEALAILRSKSKAEEEKSQQLERANLKAAIEQLSTVGERIRLFDYHVQFLKELTILLASNINHTAIQAYGLSPQDRQIILNWFIEELTKIQGESSESDRSFIEGVKAGLRTY